MFINLSMLKRLISPLQQVTDPRLCLAKEISRLGLCPAAGSNVFPQINHQVGSDLEICGFLPVKP
jgi:hypothetical protein